MDLSKVNRSWSAGTDATAGMVGDPVANLIDKIRYDFPKNWHTRIRMSEWVELPPYLPQNSVFEDKYSLLTSSSH